MKSVFNLCNAVVALVVAGLVLLPVYSALSGNVFILTMFTRIVIFALAAASLNLIMGYGGMMSFGHAAYLGIGGYAVGILAFEGVGSGFIQWPVALLASALFALVIGSLSLRTRGVYFIMITLAFAQMASIGVTPSRPGPVPPTPGAPARGRRAPGGGTAGPGIGGWSRSGWKTKAIESRGWMRRGGQTAPGSQWRSSQSRSASSASLR